LTLQEEARLKAEIQPKRPERWAIVTLALHTGCRAGELWKLRWTEVNRSGTSPQIALLDTKNKSLRHVPLNADALAALEVLAKHDEKTRHVLPRQHYRMWFEIALEAAKIEKFRFHDFRHTFGSRATMAGVDLRTLAQLMGHKTLTMTMRYSHLSPTHLQDAVSKLVGFGSIQTVSPTETNSP
jgi:integrase